jgi:hypothetical protein
MNCFADALICAAAANVLRHDFIDLSVRRIRPPIQKRGSFHDHARLAKPALRNIFGNPGYLAGMFANGGETFNGSEAFIGCGANRNLTGANGSAVFMDCARATDSHAATVLCSAEFQLVAQDPEQRRVGLGNDLAELAINVERILRHCEKALLKFDARGRTRLATWC